MREEEKKKLPREDEMVQMAIDPTTGRDITGEVISRRLKELEVDANNFISEAVKEYEVTPEKNKEIYEKYYWKIHEKLGVGSIGPATAAAGPLMYSKMDELAALLNVPDEERIS